MKRIGLLWLTLSGVAAVAARPAAAANLLANPGFESAITQGGPPFAGFWAGFTSGPGVTATNSAASPRSGSQHAQLSIANADNAFALLVQDYVGLTSGVDAFFRVWHRTPALPFDAEAEMRIEWRDSISNTEIARTANVFSTPTLAYTLQTVSGIVPAGADTARVVYAISTFGPEPANTGTAFVDDASLTVGALIPGDFDLDDDVDVADYLTVSTHLLVDVSGMTPQQSYFLGDMTGDLRVDGRDFRDFRIAYDDANGVGALAAALAAVPEPAGSLLACLGAAMLVGRRRKSHRLRRWTP